MPAAVLSRLCRPLLKRLPVRKLGAVRTSSSCGITFSSCPDAGLGPIGAGGVISLLRGLLSNMQQRDFEAEGWPELCPVLISMAGRFLFR
jgi:hypothetical protein